MSLSTTYISVLQLVGVSPSTILMQWRVVGVHYIDILERVCRSCLLLFIVHCGVDSLEDAYPHAEDEQSHNDKSTDTISKRANDEHARIDKPNTNRQQATVNKRTKVFTVYAADTNKVTPTTSSIAMYFILAYQ